MAKRTRAYGIGTPFKDVFPVPVIAARAPTTSDTNYEDGQIWIYQSTSQIYIKAKTSSGSATWSLAGPGASDVDTLTGDGGGAISPATGNITLAGGTNITTAGAGSTITFNLDAAVTLATSLTSPLVTASTSVTTPLVTAAAATDVQITAPAGQDCIIKLGDNAAANKLSIIDSDDAEVFAVDSNGGQTYTTITASGLITGNASATINTAGAALTLAADNSADAVILGGGTSARAITIGQDAAAHTIAIGQAAAGAITIDTAAGVSIDGATASNFTVTGAGQDLTLSSDGGSVLVSSTEDAALAIRLHANAGTSETIQIHSDQGTGTSSIDILSDVGGITLTATGLASDDAINLSAGAGGVDIDGAMQVNIASSENTADALVLSSSAGGIDITAAGAAGEDIDITCTSGSVNITAGESAADSIVISSSNGGIDITAAGAAAGEDIDITATGSSVNITATEDDAGAIYIHANGGTSEKIRIHADQGTADDSVELESDAGGITLTSSKDITLAGTVKEVNAEFVYSSGTDLTVSQSPILQSNLTTGAAPTGATGDVNLMYMQDGCLMEQFILGAGQTIIAPRMTANGLNIALDQADNEGAEYNFGMRANAKHVYTIGTSAAFFIEATIYVGDLSGCEPLFIGFRKVAANDADYTNYTDFYVLGLNNATSATNVTVGGRLNSGGITLQDTTDAWGGDGAAQTLKILVSAAGVCTAEVGGVAVSAPLAQTFDNADTVAPFIHFLHDSDLAGEVGLQSLKIGYQA